MKTGEIYDLAERVYENLPDNVVEWDPEEFPEIVERETGFGPGDEENRLAVKMLKGWYYEYFA